MNTTKLTIQDLVTKGFTLKELTAISNHNKYEAWKEMEEKGLKYHKGLVLHHKDVSMVDNDYWRYIQWNLDDLELMEKGAHLRLHHTGLKYSTATKHKMRMAKLGIPKSMEHRRALSEAHKRFWMKKKMEELNRQ